MFLEGATRVRETNVARVETMEHFRVGVSGWTYKHWEGIFYPEAIPRRAHLEYASRLFNSLEINGTFYSLKSPKTFSNWYEQVPSDFVFAVKGSRFITHTKRLRNVEEAMANFFANGILTLDDKLGPILWQLPENMNMKPDDFESFCRLLPRNTLEAAQWAEEHSTPQVEGRSWFAVEKKRPMRHAFEIRNPDMMNEDTIRVLRRHGHALVFADSAGKYPYAEDITAGFIYVRLHGSRELYKSGYTEEELDWWARRIRRWEQGGEMKTGPRITDLRPPERKSRLVYVYFDNDADVHAPYDALGLMQRVSSDLVPDVTAGVESPKGESWDSPPYA